MATQFVSPSEIRTKFSRALSSLYQNEVPLYASLLKAVQDVNDATLAANPSLKAQLIATDELDRLSLERHGAVRLGTADELRTVGRLFRVMSMHPVGYYDLGSAGVPVHATCFRPAAAAELSRNPFRVFASLLRTELISSPAPRALSREVLARRKIFSDRAVRLVRLCEEQGGLAGAEADEFVGEAVKTFGWHPTAVVTAGEYDVLARENPLLADVVAFPGPHVNHLTPRTLDIDEVQRAMLRARIPGKDAIEGPPLRKCPILLRQTSFKALEEGVRFPTERTGGRVSVDEAIEVGGVEGVHKARFGEIEQRGAAVTRKGLDMYDGMLRGARSRGLDAGKKGYKEAFATYPDTWKELRREGLVWCHYTATGKKGLETGDYEGLTRGELEEKLVEDGFVTYEPLVYEDFLPVSAAGIFQSNLGVKGNDVSKEAGKGDQEGFQKALGDLVIMDQMKLYEKSQAESMDKCLAHFGL
ncbi:hypothetical protein MKZ38_005988 [Zalerion maritima]|uniref:2-oxoadipate dioxygenase/decarboxylase n=1 Tax=Zalerion maritima TaxID=339359 RepID=A0AAD5RJG5_9PEZI|nr:hypothetical protein MKZ38_005988 [Zalerion maritima]